MSFRAIRNLVADIREGVRGLNSELEDFGQTVADVGRQRAEVPVFLVGPDGRPLGGSGTGFSPTFSGSTVGAGLPTPGAPRGAAESFAGKTIGRGSGGAGGSGGASAGKSSGVRKKQSVRDAIAAIVAAAGVQTPGEDRWNPTGTADGSRPTAVLAYVLENGINSPREYLEWCAGWLAYTKPDATASSESHPVGRGGPRPSRFGPKQWAEWRRQNPFSVLPPWHALAGTRPAGWLNYGGGGSEPPPGFSGGGGGGGGGWADSAFTNFGGGGSWEGSSNFDTLVSTTGKVTDAVTESGGQVVGAIRDLTREVQRGNSSTGLRAGGVL